MTSLAKQAEQNAIWEVDGYVFCEECNDVHPISYQGKCQFADWYRLYMDIEEEHDESGELDWMDFDDIPELPKGLTELAHMVRLLHCRCSGTGMPQAVCDEALGKSIRPFLRVDSRDDGTVYRCTCCGDRRLISVDVDLELQQTVVTDAYAKVTSACATTREELAEMEDNADNLGPVPTVVAPDDVAAIG